MASDERARRTDQTDRSVHSQDRRRRDRVALSVVLLTGALIGAFLGVQLCSPHRAVETGDQDLTVVLPADTTTSKTVNALVDTWNQEHPQAHATVTYIPSTSRLWHAQLLAQLQARRPVDVFGMDVNWTAEFASNGFTLPLHSDTRGFLTNPIDSCRYRGTLWALPFETDSGLLLYNRGQLHAIPKATADPPSWTWQDIAAIARDDRFAADDAYLGQFAAGERLTVTAIEALAPPEGWASETAVALTETETNRLNDVFAILNTRPNQPRLVNADKDSSRDRFAEGHSLFMRNTSLAYRRLRDTTSLDIGISLLPNPMRAVLGGTNLAVASTVSPAKRTAAIQFVEFMTDETRQRTLMTEGGLASTRSAPYLDVNGNDHNVPPALLRQSIETAQRRPVLRHYIEFSAALQAQLRQHLRVDTVTYVNDPAELQQPLAHALQGRTP